MLWCVNVIFGSSVPNHNFQNQNLTKTYLEKNVRIVQYIEHFFEEGKFLIVMEFCEGGDLMQLIEKQRPKKHFPESTVKDFFLQMTKGTAYIHSKKILHCDLKPSNIFISSDQVLKIGDFGISKKHNSTMSMANTVVGTDI